MMSFDSVWSGLKLTKRHRACTRIAHVGTTLLPGRPSRPAVRAARPFEPPHQNNNQTSTRDKSINMSSIEAAIAAIESLEPGEQFSYRQVAAEYHCNRTTLAR